VEEIAQYLLSAALQILLPFWLLRRDERQLTPKQWARSFPEATFWIAVVGFGPLALPVHFVRTRRNFKGLALGLAWLAVTLGSVIAVSFGFEKILGIIRQSRL